MFMVCIEIEYNVDENKKINNDKKNCCRSIVVAYIT